MNWRSTGLWKVSNLNGIFRISDPFLGRPYQIATSLTDKTQPQFQTIIRINDFLSFVDSKATYERKAGTFEDVEWFIVIQLSKYCPESKSFITLNSTSSDTPEFLGIYIYCKGNPNDTIGASFNIDVIVKFKRTSFSNISSLWRISESKEVKFETKIEVCLILLSLISDYF